MILWPMMMVSVSALSVQTKLCTVPRLPALRNYYFALRHGQSTANVEGVISSLPAIGTTTHGLTEEGRLQARQAAPDILKVVGGSELARKLVVVSSDFTRARETAQEALHGLHELTGHECGETKIHIDSRLRERWFGSLDGTPVSTYNQVWPLDLEDAHNTEFGVESVQSVAIRLRDLFVSLEEAHPPGTPILLTSHADTLQIMQCYVANADPRLFSQYRFKNGEVGTPELLLPVF